MQCNLIFCRLKLPHQFHFLSVRIGPIITIITRPDIVQEVLTYVNLHLNVQYSKWNHCDLIKTLTHDGMQVSLGNVTSIEQSQPCGLERRSGSWLAVRGHVITPLASDWLSEVMWSQHWPLIGFQKSCDHNTGLWLVTHHSEDYDEEILYDWFELVNRKNRLNHLESVLVLSIREVITHTHTHIHTYTHTHRNTHTHTYTHTHTRTLSLAQTHKHTHTYTHSPIPIISEPPFSQAAHGALLSNVIQYFLQVSWK